MWCVVMDCGVGMVECRVMWCSTVCVLWSMMCVVECGVDMAEST